MQSLIKESLDPVFELLLFEIMFNFSFISNQTIIQNVPNICQLSPHLMQIMQFPHLTIYSRVFTHLMETINFLGIRGGIMSI